MEKELDKLRGMIREILTQNDGLENMDLDILDAVADVFVQEGFRDSGEAIEHAVTSIDEGRS